MFSGRRALDTRAVNIIIAVFAIALIIGIFYVFLVKVKIEKQANTISSTSGLSAFKGELADWFFEWGSLTDDAALGLSLQRFLEQHRYVVDGAVVCGSNECTANVAKSSLKDKQGPFDYKYKFYRATRQEGVDVVTVKGFIFVEGP